MEKILNLFFRPEKNKKLRTTMARCIKCLKLTDEKFGLGLGDAKWNRRKDYFLFIVFSYEKSVLLTGGDLIIIDD